MRAETRIGRLAPAVLGILAAAVYAGSGPGKPVGGPYVVNVRSDRGSASVCWVTSLGVVDLQPDGGEALPVAAFKPSCVNFARLEPGRRFTYHIKELGEKGRGDFRMPAPPGSPFRFAVFGDTQRRHDVHARTAQAIAALRPDFVVHTGDMVPEGLRGEDWRRFLILSEPLLRHTVLFPAIGNHDRNDPQFYDLFRLRRPFYSFDWGDAHFTILYSDLENFSSPAERNRFEAEQDEWLKEDLAGAQDKVWRFVFFHHPPYSAHKGRQLAPLRTLSWVPLFERYRASAVFSGHDHDYQHHLRNGVHYLVSGGGGGNLDVPDEPLPITLKTASRENFLQVDVQALSVRASAIGPDGMPIEAFELKPAARKQP